MTAVTLKFCLLLCYGSSVNLVLYVLSVLEDVCLYVCLLQSTRPAANGVFHHGGCEDAQGGSLSWHAEWLSERGSAHGRIWSSKHCATPWLVCLYVLCYWDWACAKTKFPNRLHSQLDLTVSQCWTGVLAWGRRKAQNQILKHRNRQR